MLACDYKTTNYLHQIANINLYSTTSEKPKITT